MTLIVCGGRNYEDRDIVFEVLDLLHHQKPVHAIVEGGAPGADTLAYLWAKENEVNSFRYFAKWKKFKAAAGPRRNAQMLLHPGVDALVAFPGGVGTNDMVRKATHSEKRIHVFDVRDPSSLRGR